MFDVKSTGADLTEKMKILHYIKICKDFFFSKLFALLIKSSVSTQFRQFFGWKIDRRGPDIN